LRDLSTKSARFAGSRASIHPGSLREKVTRNRSHALADRGWISCAQVEHEVGETPEHVLAEEHELVSYFALVAC
jgi:hypothetical protein